MGRGFRAFHTNNNPANPGGYSIVLEQRGKNDVVLFENYAVATLGKSIYLDKIDLLHPKLLAKSLLIYDTYLLIFFLK